MKKELLYLHQLPQHLLGLLAIHTWKGEKRTYKGIDYYLCNVNASFSCGQYIIVSNRWYPDGLHDVRMRRLILHEHGHSRQSLYLGWSYLILVALPSVVLNLLCRKGYINWKQYYKLYPENWADRLGGVTRV